MGWDLLFMHQKSKKGTKVTWAVVAHGFESMGAASGKVKYLKPSAFEIPQCCWENKRENTVVPFQHEMFLWCFLRDWSVLPRWGGCARWGAAEQGWQAGTVIPLQTAFPRDLVASLKQNLCSYGKLRHSKASIPTKCLWSCWQSAGRVLDTWMLELIYFAKRSP